MWEDYRSFGPLCNTWGMPQLDTKPYTAMPIYGRQGVRGTNNRKPIKKQTKQPKQFGKQKRRK